MLPSKYEIVSKPFDFNITPEQDAELNDMVEYMGRKDKEYANHFYTLKKACLEWGKQKM